MNYGGSKLWIVINPVMTRKLITIMKEVCKLDCPYVMASKEYFIHPAMLTKRGIKLKLIVQNEGDLVVVTSGAMHCVLNMDFSISRL